MNRFRQTIRRVPAAILLALAAAAILPAGAQAEHPNDRAGMLGVGAVSSDVVAPTNPGWGAASDWARNHAELATPNVPASSDVVAPTNPGWGAAGDSVRNPVELATPNVPATAVAIRPDDRGDARGPGALSAAPPLGVPAPSGDPFQWDAAAAGAAAMVGVFLFMAGIALTIRRRGRVLLP
jgi:hypothetical protein